MSGLVLGDRTGRLGYGWWHRGWQGEDHGEAAAGRLLGDESSVHGLAEPACQSEAKAGACVIVAVAEALEGLEYAIAVGAPDAGAAVGNPQLDPIVVAACGQQHLLSGGTVAHRVARQVGEDAFEQGGVGDHVGKTARKPDVDAVSLLTQVSQDTGDDFPGASPPRRYWHRYFPAAHPIEVALFPALGEVTAIFSAAVSARYPSATSPFSWRPASATTSRG